MNKAIDIKPSSISRKTFLRLSVGTLAAVSLGPLTGCAGGRKLRFETIEDALKELALIEANEATLVMDQPWSIYKVMIHLSQSMEYSMTGYPELLLHYCLRLVHLNRLLLAVSHPIQLL